MRNIIIVTDEKNKKFADYLMQLISLNDDTDENTVGIKDGSVEAMVWEEKHYTANAANISSEQYFLFIGDSKLIKEKRSFMKTIYSNFGISYGWLGKQAYLAVDKVVSKKEYDGFIEFAQKYQENIEKLIVSKKTKQGAAAVGISGAAAVGAKGAAIALGGKAAAVAGIALSPIALIPLIGVGASIPIISKIKLNSKIKDQMYACGTMKFYLEDLSKFLEL